MHLPVELVNNVGKIDPSLCAKEHSVAKEQHELGDAVLYFILFLNQHRYVS